MGWTHIQTQTASNSSSIDFTSPGFTTDYHEYLFLVTNYQPITDSKDLRFQVDVGTATTYGQTFSSTQITAGHGTNDAWSLLEVHTGQSLDAGYQKISYGGEAISNYPEMGVSGYLRFFDPSNGVHSKMFESIFNTHYKSGSTEYIIDYRVTGKIDTTTALTRIRFEPRDEGNLGTGKFAMYGLS
jgi:hypothetical protein